MNHSEYLNHHESLCEFIDYAIGVIYDDEIWKKKELLEVAEITYTYDQDTGINTRLFSTIWELNLDKYKQINSFDIKETLFSQSYTKTKNTLKTKISQISIIIRELWNLYHIDLWKKEKIAWELFMKALLEKKQLLQYALLALPFEKQKAWYDPQLSTDEFIRLNNHLHQIDRELFWWDVQEHPEEVDMFYSSYMFAYKENKQKLSLDEQKTMEQFLSITSDDLPEWYEYSTPETAKKIDTKFLQKTLTREEYIPLFNEVLKWLKDSDHIAQVKENISSVCDTQNSIDFPDTEKFQTLTLERILTLMNHECEAHCISDHNSQSILWKIRWAWSTMKDEWVAVLMEQMLLYGEEIYTQKSGKTIIDTSKISINPAYMQILMCEKLWNDELKEFLDISYKLIWDNITPEERYKRLKRNHITHGQHKDILYFRWLFQAIDEINTYILSDGKQWLSFQDMFLWKVSFEDTKDLKELRQLSSEENIDFEEQNELLQPKFIAETIYYLLKNNLVTQDGKIDRSFSQNIFLKHLQKKYPLLELNETVFNHITYTTKKSLYKVLWILAEHDKSEKEKKEEI